VLTCRVGALGRSLEVRTPLLPLAPGIRRRFDELPADPSPTHLIQGRHFWAGNETSPHLWYPAVHGRGGAFLGVGTDLNYTLSAWARAELMVVVDFDQAIVDLHRCYLGLLERCETPLGFVAAWSHEHRASSIDLLRERWADDDRRNDIVRAFRSAQPMVATRLARMRVALRAQSLPSFSDDARAYAHVRSLACTRRIVVVRGNYDGRATLVALAAALVHAGLPLGVVYLSNVEEYLDYTPNFRRNFLALDTHRDAVVVRACSGPELGAAHGERYHYNVQSASTFAGWLRHGDVPRLAELLRFRAATREFGLSSLDARAPMDDVRAPHDASRVV
jgi:hypothetical protein